MHIYIYIYIHTCSQRRSPESQSEPTMTHTRLLHLFQHFRKFKEQISRTNFQRPTYLSAALRHQASDRHMYTHERPIHMLRMWNLVRFDSTGSYGQLSN